MSSDFGGSISQPSNPQPKIFLNLRIPSVDKSADMSLTPLLQQVLRSRTRMCLWNSWTTWLCKLSDVLVGDQIRLITCEQLYTRYSGCKVLDTLMWMIPIWSQRSCTVWAMQRMSSSVSLSRRRCLSELWSLQCPCNRRSWPVALSQMQAEDEEVLHSPIPLILSSQLYIYTHCIL